MKNGKNLYKNCPYEDYGFSSCRVYPNFQKCSNRKGEQIKKRNEKDEFKDFVVKLEVFLVCVLFLTLIIGMFASITSSAQERQNEEVGYATEPAQGVGRVTEDAEEVEETENVNNAQGEIGIVTNPKVIVASPPEPKYFEGIRVVEVQEPNEFGPCKDVIYVLSEEDMKYIAKVVWAEARGECFEGQVAVAAVILNRLVSGRSEFNTESVYKLVTQSGAFASIKGVDENDLAEYPDCMRAVKLACRGWDPTRETFENGALYFFNPDGVYGYQARIREGIIVHTIGNHAFHVDFNWDAVEG